MTAVLNDFFHWRKNTELDMLLTSPNSAIPDSTSQLALLISKAIYLLFSLVDDGFPNTTES